MSIKLKNLISEKISTYKRDKDVEIFDYSNIAETEWRKLIHKAQDFQGIHFDLENNDSTGQKRVLYISKNLRKNQPVKYQINAELYEAGGDWEFPVMYFRLEFKHDYGILNSKYYKNPVYIWDFESDYSGLYRNYVLIPPASVGNKLRAEENKWYAFTDDDITQEENKKLMKITDSDRKGAWKWLIDLINSVVENRHEMLDV